MAAAWLASGYSAYQILPTLYNMLNAESKKEVVDYALNSRYGGYVLERIDDLCGLTREYRRRLKRRRKMPAFRSAKTNVVHAPLFTSRKALRNAVAINRIRNGVKHRGFRRDGLLARELDKMKLV